MIMKIKNNSKIYKMLEIKNTLYHQNKILSRIYGIILIKTI